MIKYVDKIPKLSNFSEKKTKSLQNKSKKNFIEWVPLLQKKIEGKFDTIIIVVSNIANRMVLFSNGKRINGWDLYLLYRYNFIKYQAKNKDDKNVEKWIENFGYMNLIAKTLASRKNDYRNNLKNYCLFATYLDELVYSYGYYDRFPEHLTERKDNQCIICQNPELMAVAENDPEYISESTALHLELIKDHGKKSLNYEFRRVSEQKRSDLIYKKFPYLKCTCED